MSGHVFLLACLFTYLRSRDERDGQALGPESACSANSMEVLIALTGTKKEEEIERDGEREEERGKRK